MEHFYSLTPDKMLDAVEKALRVDGRAPRSTGRWLALNSMENRVYDIELEDGSRVVTKFYRPGRWTRDAILDEHRFILELTEAEVPAVAPLPLSSGSTLDVSEDGIYLAVFPKVRGQILQELDDSQLEQIGRLVARLHNVGARHPAPHRLTLSPETYGSAALSHIEQSGLIEPQSWSRYQPVAQALIDVITPLYRELPVHRIHGDCHLGNVLWFRTGPFFVDFDDMVMGPAVQDIWMIVRGVDAESQRQREVLLRGYEQMREFDKRTLRLIEPLRALRLIHYAAWIARRWEDPAFKNAFPDFGSTKYWEEQAMDLREQLARVQE